jgi:hypothetical protein
MADLLEFSLMCKIAKERGATIISSNEDFKQKKDVVFICAECEKQTTKTYEVCKPIEKNIPKIGLCRGCSIRASKGTDAVNFEKFEELAISRGYTLVSTKKDYKNAKTSMIANCSEGHECHISYQTIKETFRCRECNGMQNKKTFEEAEKIFASKGNELLADRYVNKTTLMYCRCKCGIITEKTLESITRGNGGCQYCYKFVNWDDILDVCETRGIQMISTRTDYQGEDTQLSIVCICENNTTLSWRQINKGTFCSECETKRRKITVQIRYGVDNVSRVPEIKEKISTSLKQVHKQDPSLRERSKETNMKNHGGIHNLNLPTIRSLSQEAVMEKFGVRYPLQSQKIRDKVKATTMARYGQPYFMLSDKFLQIINDKYGNVNMVETDHFINVMIERYGTRHAMQNKELFDKMVKSSFSLKEITTPSGKIIHVQGYEEWGYLDLIDMGFNENQIETSNGGNVPTIKYKHDNKDKVYYPDLGIPPDLVVEVKSTYTFMRDYEKNMAKFKAVAEQGYNMLVWIYNRNRNDREQIFFPAIPVVTYEI